jgi:DNA-binding beta-propeller fold protein YncE
MKLRSIPVALLLCVLPELSAGQEPPKLANTLPTYVRKFQSDRDVNRPTRLDTFAFKVSGYPSSEDAVVDADDALGVEPLKYPQKIFLDTPHVVRSARSAAPRLALSLFPDAITEHLRSHTLFMVRPSSVITDSETRVLVADPTAHSVHVFDLAANRYFRIQGGENRRLQAPWGIAVDSAHNIYVTDLELGMILVYDRNGRFQRYIGKRDDGEGGYFDRPSGIAIDPKSGRIFLLDTTRHMLVVLDRDGNVARRLGRPDLDQIALRTRDGGESAKGNLQFPTDIVIRDGEVFVLGSSKITVLDLDGHLQKEVTVMGGNHGGPEGLAVDSSGDLFVSDPAAGSVHAYDRNGVSLYSFGQLGSKHGEFHFPRGLWIDEHNQIYVSDSKNGRVQVFQLHPQASPTH